MSSPLQPVSTPPQGGPRRAAEPGSDVSDVNPSLVPGLARAFDEAIATKPRERVGAGMYLRPRDRTRRLKRLSDLEPIESSRMECERILISTRPSARLPRARSAIDIVADPQTGVAPGWTRGRHMRSRCRCSMCSAIHINSRSWLRSSSTHEPSDPPFKVVLNNVFFLSDKNDLIKKKFANRKKRKTARRRLEGGSRRAGAAL